MTVTLSRAALAGPLTPETLAAGATCFTQPTRADLCVYRGDSGRVRVTVTEPDSTPIDVSEASWDCDLRVSTESTEVIATLTVLPVPGVPNAVDVILSAESSALLSDNCMWDLEMTLDGEVTTLLYGQVFVTRDVSRP